MDWRVKAVIQGVLSRCPGGGSVNDLLQRLAGGRRNLPNHIASKVKDDWLVHMANLKDLGFTVQGLEMLEIGTGWLPVMPLCFALAGVNRCYTLDQNRHLSPNAVVLALKLLKPHLDLVAEAAGMSGELVKQRWLQWLELDNGFAVLEAAGISYHAPADATICGLADASISLVFSNSVLEHVPPNILDALMEEARRVLKPGGLALHSVNCGDHYAYFDRNINAIHYLRYTEREWRWLNNDILFQNRLRPVDFIEAANTAGLEVIMDTHRPNAELLSRFEELRIAPEFRHYPPDQLCSTSVDFAAQRT